MEITNMELPVARNHWANDATILAWKNPVIAVSYEIELKCQ